MHKWETLNLEPYNMNCVAGFRPFIVSRKSALFVSNRGMMEKGSEPFYRRPEFSKPVAANRAVG
jgi:hypothetical protein